MSRPAGLSARTAPPWRSACGGCCLLCWRPRQVQWPIHGHHNLLTTRLTSLGTSQASSLQTARRVTPVLRPAGMQERDLLSVLRLVALALDKYPTIFAGGQRGAVGRLFGRLLPICTEAHRSRCGLTQVLPSLMGFDCRRAGTSPTWLIMLDNTQIVCPQMSSQTWPPCRTRMSCFKLSRHVMFACRTARALVTDVVVKIVSLVAAADHELYAQLRLGALDLLLGALFLSQVRSIMPQRRSSRRID